MNKDAIKAKILSLTETELESAKQHYEDYIADSKLDKTEPLESDEIAQSSVAAQLATAFDQPIHDFNAKIRHLQDIDFGPKSEVEEGAIIKFNNRYFIVAVSTSRFSCEGVELMGISMEAPIFKALEGKTVGEDCEFNGKPIIIQEIH